MTKKDFVLVRSDEGDGGWSLHAVGSTDEQISTGDAPYLACGPAEFVDGEWNRPDDADYRRAQLNELCWLCGKARWEHPGTTRGGWDQHQRAWNQSPENGGSK